ncbi:hypothetical protein PC9H_007435 [Pleurotus ostreatus]|uniref:EXS domain-containing protein n=1 Tax=Pleurotus ostreatus TaxID=5322 RepID=A0A8H6ZTE6_PLEOS|nr:uncharacterized protein PC9H_007435 [Pleurotus ostreatus]KAF7428214.1 hypothetical protein PC9H_007435 [Pleurotus ostreatus]
MDDADPEHTLAAVFPLPFRVLLLVGVGILGWATNVHGLDLLKVDIVGTMELRTHDTSQPISLPLRANGHQHPPRARFIYSSTYKLFGIYCAWGLASWLLYCSATWNDPSLVDAFGYIPAISALCIILVLISPFEICQKFERDKFLHALRRCLFPHMDGRIYFADVVFADICTSFAKVLGDVWLSLCMLSPGNSLLIPPTLSGLSRWVLPIIMSLPYAIRFRQCVVEYSAASNESTRPLYNALKYATAFPLIFLSAAQRVVVIDGQIPVGSVNHSGTSLFRWWLFAAAVNSLYSFWWDVTNDWGLDLLKRSGQGERDKPSPPKKLMLPLLNRSHIPTSSSDGDTTLLSPSLGSSRVHMSYPWGLRPVLLYPLPTYPLVVFLNLILRLTWSIKLSSHLHSQTDGSASIFWLEVAEIIRRWMWVFIRVEWEVVKSMHKGSKPHIQEYEMIMTPENELTNMVTM